MRQGLGLELELCRVSYDAIGAAQLHCWIGAGEALHRLSQTWTL